MTADGVSFWAIDSLQAPNIELKKFFVAGMEDESKPRMSWTASMGRQARIEKGAQNNSVEKVIGESEIEETEDDNEEEEEDGSPASALPSTEETEEEEEAESEREREAKLCRRICRVMRGREEGANKSKGREELE